MQSTGKQSYQVPCFLGNAAKPANKLLNCQIHVMPEKQSIAMYSAQAHTGDFVAQAGGHRDRDDYNPRMAPDPETLPAFANMPKTIFTSLDRLIEQMTAVCLWHVTGCA